MDTSPCQLAFVAVAGPQASGKSTIAEALREHLLDRGERVALVSLDRVAEMALPSLPSWLAARQIFGSVAAQWASTELTCVIAEGVSSADEVDALMRRAPPGAVTVRAVTTTSFDRAFARAQNDPTRGVSRERDFPARVYARWQEHLPTMRPDVVLDTGERTVADCAADIRICIDRARAFRQASLEPLADG